ncbi:DUF3124 domain-containing protein [Dechloromonas hortensis]|uniref:DUF3124 domain-containing protein n=1 Tax=Dechloromonas hortensis TaxID=337779 RepID=UPI00129259AF|nr:DUF3124 domain-containing protein [Dechloromonas hortensis]
MQRMKKMRAGLFALVFCLFGQSTAGIAQEARPLSKGQSVYLPIYSHMLYGNLGKSGKASFVLLSALVSIRNTDSKRPLRILSAKYFDTQGKLLGERVSGPTVLPPLGTLELFVELNDASGGSGANFVVKWEADAAINPPLVEALHANMDGGKAVIFTTQSVPVAD